MATLPTHGDKASTYDIAWLLVLLLPAYLMAIVNEADVIILSLSSEVAVEHA